MENLARQEEILDYVKTHKFASVAELAEMLYTSQATVRRDIEKLEAKGALKTVYGGAVAVEYEKEPIPIYIRDKENSPKKEKIAAAAARLIKDNSTVIFDSSSTVRRMCKYIKSRKGLTVVTNNLRVCSELKDSDVKVVCTGGTLVQKRECFVGHFAEDFIRRIRADMLFFSSQGISDTGDVTDSSEEEIALRRVMLDAAKEKYFLFDSSKKGKEYPFLLCNVSSLDGILSDD
ncbi:MAG: DeoR/GlpR transcriptional regulator [Clostridia bacterium]|nr:DeoR/GlpR transcriptional regulator [Clostridia bacterium]